MDIKGPQNLTPAEQSQQSARVEPVAGVRSPASSATTVSESVLLKLSPSLFRLGQLLDVLVTRVEKEALTLLVQNRIAGADGQPVNLQLRAPAIAGVVAGQRLTVQVSELKNQLPQLQVIHVQPARPPIGEWLAQAEQRQQPGQILYEHAHQLRQLQPRLSELPLPVQDRLTQLWRTLPEASAIQKPQQLRQAIQHAGPFLEHHLLQQLTGTTRHQPGLDVKTSLLRLAEALRHTPLPQTSTMQTATVQSRAQTTSPPPPLRANTSATANQDRVQARVNPDFPAPPVTRSMVSSLSLHVQQILDGLREQVDGALQRILTQQLHMANADSSRPSLIFELPVRHESQVDVFDFRIHPDAEGQQQEEPQQRPWTVMLAFELDGLGPVRVQVNYHQQQLRTHWWAEQPQTVQLFTAHVERLRDRLGHMGIDVARAECQLGIPRTPDENRPPAQDKPLPGYSDINVDENV